MLFACLHIRRPRRLNHLRRLAETPLTATRLPGPLLPAPHPTTPASAPEPTGPAAADPDELQVRAWLHQYGRPDTTTSNAAMEARR
ncbi:hypothetical protein [Streptomyces sp. NPDC087511]|uniref:hypothetical protein n=1 Tax=Streptomyces sp. NPDC087511 TaxID=3365792 RepID=UPI00380FB4E0